MQRHVLDSRWHFLPLWHLYRATPATPALHLPQAENALASLGALGVSRVVEVDATDGPQFGSQQYKLNDFLEPGEVVLTFDDGPLRAYTTILAAP